MLFMYYPFRDEKELLSGNPPTYVSTEVVDENYSFAEPFATIFDEVAKNIVDFSDNSETDRNNRDSVSRSMKHKCFHKSTKSCFG